MTAVRLVDGASSPELEVSAGSSEHAPPAPPEAHGETEVPMLQVVPDSAPLLFAERLARWLADVAEHHGRRG